MSEGQEKQRRTPQAEPGSQRETPQAEPGSQRGTLFLCATPIGNLGDITLRALDTLRAVDLIAAEDTRNSRKLLTHFDIHTPLTSFHQHNQEQKAPELIASLREGKNIALVTDAGTPGISDPGELLVRRCREEGIPVTSLPGACACITALSLSGLSIRRFCFEGFLPAEKKERRRVLEDCREETRTMVFYEAPHRLRRTLGELAEVLGDRKATLCRELTKLHEDTFATTLEQAVAFYEGAEPRGEYVLVVAGKSPAQLEADEELAWREMDLKQHVAYYEGQGMGRKEAMRLAAEDRGVSRREVYRGLLEESD